MKLNGTFAPLDTRFDDHPKYIEYGAAEMGVIACAITHCNRMLSDGVVPKVWPMRRFGPEVQPVVERLVRDGIWKIRSDGNYEIVGYLDHNRSKAEIEERKAIKAAAGKAGGQKSANARQAVAQATAQAPASASGQAGGQAPAQAVAQATGEPIYRSDPDPDQIKSDPQQKPQPSAVGSAIKLPASEERLWGEHRRQLYADAVRRSLGPEATWGFDVRQSSILTNVIESHCVDKTRIDDWIGSVVPEFVHAVADEAKFWSGYQPKGLMSWLNQRHGTKRQATAASSHEVVRESHLGRVWVQRDGKRVPEDPDQVVDGKVMRLDPETGKWKAVPAEAAS